MIVKSPLFIYFVEYLFQYLINAHTDQQKLTAGTKKFVNQEITTRIILKIRLHKRQERHLAEKY